MGSDGRIAEATGYATTAANGGFTLSVPDDRAAGASLYLVARGGKPPSGTDNPAIILLAVLGPEAPATVTVNEMTTVASVWTNAQFLNGSDIQGPPLSLKIAAGNVPSSSTSRPAAGAGRSRTR